MLNWYAHVTWTASPADGPVKDTMAALAATVHDFDPGPGAYVLAPQGATWRAGFTVRAAALDAAATAALTTIGTAALAAGQLDAEVTAVEVLGEAHRERWMPDLPPVRRSPGV